MRPPRFFCGPARIQAPLPRPILRLATQRVVARIFHALEREAAKIRSGGSAHAVRIQRDAHIYLDWMLPRIDAALDLNNLRNIVPALGSMPNGTSRRPTRRALI